MFKEYRLYRHSGSDMWPSIKVGVLGLPPHVKNKVYIPAIDPFTNELCEVHGVVSQHRLYLNHGWMSARLFAFRQVQDEKTIISLNLEEKTVVPPEGPTPEPPAPRPTRDETMMNVAEELAQRSTCQRRMVGAVIVDELGRVLSTGYNGVPTGDVHCTDQPCPGVGMMSGVGLDVCRAVHAETNALLFCPDVMKIDTIYVTASPCMHCIRALLNTSCQRIVYGEEYSLEALEWWRSMGRRDERI